MATELAGDAIRLNVEDDDDAIVLEGAVVSGRGAWHVTAGGGVAYPSGGEQVAAVAEAD